MKEYFWKYYDSGAERKDAKKFGNVVHPSLLASERDTTAIISLVQPPELHLLTGPFNTMYTAMLSVWPGSVQWLEKCHVRREQQQGGCFTGNSSSKLLKNVDILDCICPLECKPFVRAFRSFRNVVCGCYGELLNPRFKELIASFRQDYLDLGINVTPKVHMVFFHVQDFCAMKRKGLGPWSEQTSEAIHLDFRQMWNRFKLSATSHPNYGNQLLRAVSMYNSQHL